MIKQFKKRVNEQQQQQQQQHYKISGDISSFNKKSKLNLAEEQLEEIYSKIDMKYVEISHIKKECDNIKRQVLAKYDKNKYEFKKNQDSSSKLKTLKEQSLDKDLEISKLEDILSIKQKKSSMIRISNMDNQLPQPRKFFHLESPNHYCKDFNIF